MLCPYSSIATTQNSCFHQEVFLKISNWFLENHYQLIVKRPINFGSSTRVLSAWFAFARQSSQGSVRANISGRDILTIPFSRKNRFYLKMFRLTFQENVFFRFFPFFFLFPGQKSGTLPCDWSEAAKFPSESAISHYSWLSRLYNNFLCPRF